MNPQQRARAELARRELSRRQSFASQPDEQGDYWGDVGKNAVEGLQEIPGAIRAQVPDAMKIGRAMVGGFAESGIQVAQGIPFGQTPVGEAASAAGRMAGTLAEGAWQGVKDTGSAVIAPLERMGGTPWGQTELGQKFRERPLSTPLGVAGTAIPLLKGARMATGAGKAAFAGSEANILERAGARGVNNALGIDYGTVQDMTKRGANPGKVGVNLGIKLHEEGLSGKNPTVAYDEAFKLQDKYGKEVGAALNEIKSTNKGLGEYAELADPLKVEATPILKPFLDKANELRESGYPNEKFESRFHRAAYNSLSNEATKNGGFITIDHVTSEMRRMGNMLKTASDDHVKIIKKIYGKLANVRDEMVEELASSLDKPELADKLRSANANFSRSARILPDIHSASAKESVGKSSFLRHPLDTTAKALEPRMSQAVLGAGKLLRGGANLADDLTGIPGNVASRINNLSGDNRGSVFPEPPLRDMTASEQSYGNFKQSYDRHSANYDWKNVLKDKWGMHRNTGGNDVVNAEQRRAIITQYIENRSQGSR